MVQPETWAKVSFNFRGFHQWSDAPDEVRHLRDRHRHVFEVTVQAKQTHDDRDLEYIMMKRDLEDWARNTLGDGEPVELGEQSCEMVAKKLIQYLRDEHDKMREYKAEVLEDGENGAKIHAKITDNIDIRKE